MDVLKIGDEKVKAATNKAWAQWFKILDTWKAKAHGHTETAKHLHNKYGLNGWWCQTVTVRYEKERKYWKRSGTE